MSLGRPDLGDRTGKVGMKGSGGGGQQGYNEEIDFQIHAGFQTEREHDTLRACFQLTFNKLAKRMPKDGLARSDHRWSSIDGRHLHEIMCFECLEGTLGSLERVVLKQCGVRYLTEAIHRA